MRILVCVKQVPDTAEIKIDPVTNTLIRAGVPSIVNPFDACALEVAARIKDATDLDPRVTVLGHIQRGGSPTGRDRVNATKMGYMAVELLLKNKTNRIICIRDGDYIDVDIEEALALKKSIQQMEVDVLSAMTGFSHN